MTIDDPATGKDQFFDGKCVLLKRFLARKSVPFFGGCEKLDLGAGQIAPGPDTTWANM
jgi:hypothetical protein